MSSAVQQAIETLKKSGAKTVEISLPHSEYALAVYYIIAPCEASSNLARFDGVKYGFRAKGTQDLLDMYQETRWQGFGAEVKRRIMLGTYALSAGYYDAYYLKASRVRTLIRDDFEKAFEKCDVIVTPTAPTAAFKLGEKVDDPLQMYLSDIFTIPCNLAGIPGPLSSLRFHQGRPSHRSSDSRQSLPGRENPAGGLCFRTKYGTSSEKSSTMKKSKGKDQKAKIKNWAKIFAFSFPLPFDFCLLPFDFFLCLCASQLGVQYGI